MPRYHPPEDEPPEPLDQGRKSFRQHRGEAGGPAEVERGFPARSLPRLGPTALNTLEICQCHLQEKR